MNIFNFISLISSKFYIIIVTNPSMLYKRRESFRDRERKKEKMRETETLY
jgi:adenylate kinase